MAELKNKERTVKRYEEKDNFFLFLPDYIILNVFIGFNLFLWSRLSDV